MKIAIMGATGHVAKNLIDHLKGDELYLFSRTKFNSYDFFDSYDYDAIINCIGYGNPADIEKAGPDLFFVTEKYDNLALEYLKRHEETKYIFISSGVVHSPIDINHITKQNFYQVPWKNENFNISPLGIAHADLINTLSSRIEDYIIRSKI